MVKKHNVYDLNSLILLQTSFMTQNMGEYIAKMFSHSEIVTSMKFTYNWSQCPETAASSSSTWAVRSPDAWSIICWRWTPGSSSSRTQRTGDQHPGLRCAPWALETRWRMRLMKSVNLKRCWICCRKRAWVQILSACWSTARCHSGQGSWWVCLESGTPRG